MTDWHEILTEEERGWVEKEAHTRHVYTSQPLLNSIRRLAGEVARLEDRNAFLQHELDKADPLDPATLRYLEYEKKIEKLEAENAKLLKPRSSI